MTYKVFSNSKNHRYDADVPILVPEVNADHLAMIGFQQRTRKFTSGFIVTNPNCSTTGLVVALKPIEDVSFSSLFIFFCLVLACYLRFYYFYIVDSFISLFVVVLIGHFIIHCDLTYQRILE